MEVYLQSPINEIMKDIDWLSGSQIPSIVSRALNRTIKGVRTDSVRDISKKTGLKQKEVREQIKLNTATRQRLSAGIDATKARARNLINFVSPSTRKPNHYNSRRRLKRGGLGKYKSEGVRARAWGKSKVYKGSFIGTGKNGATLVFARTTSSRFPIKSLKGPSVRVEFGRTVQRMRHLRSANERFEKEMKALTSYELMKKRKRVTVSVEQ